MTLSSPNKFSIDGTRKMFSSSIYNLNRHRHLFVLFGPSFFFLKSDFFKETDYITLTPPFITPPPTRFNGCPPPLVLSLKASDFQEKSSLGAPPRLTTGPILITLLKLRRDFIIRSSLLLLLLLLLFLLLLLRLLLLFFIHVFIFIYPFIYVLFLL